MVRVVAGNVLDIVVDISKSSPTFGKHVSLELSGGNKKQFFIPEVAEYWENVIKMNEYQEKRFVKNSEIIDLDKGRNCLIEY
ncbi:MAG: dTDP-4-dehydrorhamnose 3,5-epimerase family protein [Bacteroidetes bacterium]|nr:dTDP-4-dehydrorhamnose 3,5-epimerase family protein [Bacteroidota bacterium]